MNGEENVVSVKMLDTRTGETFETMAYYVSQMGGFSPIGLNAGPIVPLAIKVGDKWHQIISEA
jgi:hypothetical protein